MIDVYDSEIVQIEHVMETLKSRSAGRRDYEAFDREIKERFAEIGLKISVNWHTAADEHGRKIEDTHIPEITIDGRLDGRVFDPDRMVHEVTSDLLGLGEGGVIDTSKTTPEQKAARDAHKGHSHGS